MPLNSLLYIVGLFITLNIVGILLCLKLYQWDRKAFFNSSLWRKITLWTPIFSLFIALIYIGKPLALVTVCVIYFFAIKEYVAAKRKDSVTVAYLLCFIVATGHIVLLFDITQQPVASLLLIIGFCSALSDVCAFFFGKYFGKHYLQSYINPAKSWEGVAGQIIGAFIGYVLLLPILPISTSLLLVFAIGAASALGDIYNSIVKRRAHIKDWGNTIPGHGGVMDRLASLSFACMASYYVMTLL